MADESPSYDQLAWVYNRHFAGYAERILTPLHDLVLRDLPPPRRLLNLCCGTGQLDRALQTLGYEVTGIDESPEMIRFARENAPECDFVVADARDFSVPGTFDAALCLYDSLNHLMATDDLHRAFRAIHTALRPSSPFLFDLNMEDGFRQRWRGSFGIVEDDLVCVVRSRFHEEQRRGEFLATILRNESGWSRSDVLLQQRCYRVQDVTSALSAEGFLGIRVLDAVNDLGLTGQVGRSLFVCSA